MTPDDLILISVDDHVVEPPDMFEGRLPAALADRAPRVVRKDDGSDQWLYEGREIPNVGLNAVAGRPPAEYGVDPTSFAEIRQGAYLVDHRIDDMNANGVLASMNFPSFPQFCGQMFSNSQDKELGLAVLRAWNDWHIEDWCGSHPGRFIPLGLIPYWDPELMAAEVRRLAALGCHAVTWSENPEKLGVPSYHNPHWDPFWAACEETGTVVCIHIGSSGSVAITSMEAPITTMLTLTAVGIFQTAGDLLWSPVLDRFPKLRFMLSEGGTGWIPYFLERADYVYRNHRVWTGSDFGDQLPSERFRERFITCFIDDAADILQRKRMIETLHDLHRAQRLFAGIAERQSGLGAPVQIRRDRDITVGRETLREIAHRAVHAENLMQDDDGAPIWLLRERRVGVEGEALAAAVDLKRTAHHE